MNRKTILKIVVDIGMTVMLLLLMAYERIGAAVHEWLGMAMFVLFIIHHYSDRALVLQTLINPLIRNLTAVHPLTCFLYWRFYLFCCFIDRRLLLRLLWLICACNIRKIHIGI